MTEPTPPPTPEKPTDAPIARPQRSLLRPPPPRRDEPRPSAPPVLDRVEISSEPPKLRELDAAIEAELEAALAGFSTEDFASEPAKAVKQSPSSPKGPQKGRVVA